MCIASLVLFLLSATSSLFPLCCFVGPFFALWIFSFALPVRLPIFVGALTSVDRDEAVPRPWSPLPRPCADMDHDDSPEMRACVDDSMVHHIAAGYNSQFADRAVSSTPDPRPFSPLPTTPPSRPSPAVLDLRSPASPPLRVPAPVSSSSPSLHLVISYIHRPQLESYSTSPLPVLFGNLLTPSSQKKLPLPTPQIVRPGGAFSFCGSAVNLRFGLSLRCNGLPVASPFPPPSRPFALLIVNAALIAFRLGPSSQLALLSTSDLVPSPPHPILSPHITGRPFSPSQISRGLVHPCKMFPARLELFSLASRPPSPHSKAHSPIVVSPSADDFL
ncbi:hypothetical protein C8R45DRAFT_1216332 [Mycena sanguinolenta]|nr:hypothetical protein C8R45DRAFT_1216332 [Mycena sanguinolenta]